MPRRGGGWRRFGGEMPVAARWSGCSWVLALICAAVVVLASSALGVACYVLIVEIADQPGSINDLAYTDDDDVDVELGTLQDGLVRDLERARKEGFHPQDLDELAGRTTVPNSSADERSWELRQPIGHGLFAQYPLGALPGEADEAGDSDGDAPAGDPQGMWVDANAAGDEMTFIVRGVCWCAVQGLRIQVYDVSGRAVFQGESSAPTLLWDLTGADGAAVANGVYLVVPLVNVRGLWYGLGVRKLAVVR
jgi:hypothetical protein